MTLLHEILEAAAARSGSATALVCDGRRLDYTALHAQVASAAAGYLALGVQRGDRVAVFLEKRVEAVVACFAAAAAGGVFVPVNPLAKPPQLAHVLNDCRARLLVTSASRLRLVADALDGCPALAHVVVVDGADDEVAGEAGAVDDSRKRPWESLASAPAHARPRVLDTDMTAILYTSGSTGRPKGVVVSHRNMAMGAKSVAQYLHLGTDDRLLAALPLAFDAGFSQLTTAFLAGASVVLLNPVLPRDVIAALQRERITGLTAVPPLYIQLAREAWSGTIDGHLRFFACTGGRLPRETLQALRRHVPSARPYLMYGLTEAFRSTYLPPEEIDRRPGSIGRAIPHAEVLVLREDGSPCAVDEPGELVHRGPLVTLGYWNDPARTAERFRPLPPAAGVRAAELPLPETVVFSGDTVKRDADGYLYFIGRRDEMIKTSGYRVSPTEVEEVLYATGQVGECAAFGIDDPHLGQAIQVVATPVHPDEPLDTEALRAACRAYLPGYMMPAGIQVTPWPLPRTPNGKIDRRAVAAPWLAREGHAS